MKPNLQKILLGLSASSLLAFAAVAQETPNPRTDRPDYNRDRLPGTRRADRLNGAAKASEIIGMTVKNYQDEKLGKVEDLAIDVESGRIIQAILSTGGFVGIGDTLTAVPPGALHHDVTHKVLHLDADKEKLKASPRFEMSRWNEQSDAAHLTAVYRHYGEEPAYTFVRNGNGTVEGQRTRDGAPNPTPKRNADGTLSQDRITRDSQATIPASRLAQLQKASKLLGTPVRNLQNEKLGDVDNLLLDLPSGRVVAVVVSSGGFLGMGDELSAVPPAAFAFSADRSALQLDVSKDLLTRAPHFKSNQWPDFAQPHYAQGVYRAYQVEPYFTTDLSKDTDNTGQNVRDRNDRTLTPLDQGSSKADVETTARIRKEVVAGKDLSVNAKNVKIITNNGRVTLRGPVNSEQEKRLIGEIAIRIASSDAVDNQLEVKRATTGKD